LKDWVYQLMLHTGSTDEAADKVEEGEKNDGTADDGTADDGTADSADEVEKGPTGISKGLAPLHLYICSIGPTL
jgi:hypothetical protein